MHLIHQINLAVTFSEFIFRIHENESHLGGNLLAALENGTRIILNLNIFLLRNNAPGNDFFSGDILVMALHSFGRRSDYRFRKCLAFNHSVRKRHTAQRTFSFLIFTPRMACKTSSDNHFHTVRLTFVAHSDHRIRGSNFPVRKDIRSSIQELGSYLIENLAFERNSLGKDHIECGNPVGNHHYQILAVNIIDITDFPDVFADLSGKIEIGLYNCIHRFICYEVKFNPAKLTNGHRRMK